MAALPGLPDDAAPERLGDRLWSCLPPEERQAHYDLIAAPYDRLISSRLYNRWAWGVDEGAYARFLDEAIAAAGGGRLLDAGCGSAVLSAPAYRRHDVEAVLLDRSLGMLRRADDRVPSHLHLLQADLYDLPFAEGAFDTVLHFGVAHVLDDPAPVLGSLARVVRPGGTVHVASLVRTDRTCGNAFLRVLQAAGEVAPARSPDQVVEWLARHGAVTHRVEGSWLFARCLRPGGPHAR